MKKMIPALLPALRNLQFRSPIWWLAATARSFMYRKITPTLLLLFMITACNNSNSKHNNKRKLKLTVQVVPEGNGTYYISWKDTIGQSRHYTPNDRPIELWCLIKQHADTIGLYKGASSTRNYEYFSTNDTMVEVTFMTGPNIFSKNLTQERLRDIIQNNKETITFTPVTIHLTKDLRKEQALVLTEQ